MSIDPKSLKLFTSVVKYGTIASAAEGEHIAAAAVSRRISDLERLFDTSLLERSNKGVAPTAAGQALLDLSYRVLNELDDIKQQMQSYAKGMKGHVRIFANISAITQFLPEELSRFVDEHPDVQIHLEEHVSSVIVQAILENKADIGIITLDGGESGVELLPYREDRLVVVMPKGHALAGKESILFEETIDFDYVGLPPGSQVNKQLIRAARELGRPWRSRFTVNSYDALCLMVESKLGVGVLPHYTAAKYTRIFNVHTAVLEDVWARRQLAICIRQYQSLSPIARQLLDRMLTAVPK